jgi:hypothetical protein
MSGAANPLPRQSGPAAPEPPASFRHHLQQELIRRTNANPAYSLRAFARFLQINHASLLRLIAGERPLSRKMIQRLGLRLGMDLETLAKFLPEGVRGRGSSPAEAPISFQQMSIDQFSVISDWYHHAILELTHTAGFRPDPRWIARVLGINPLQARAAVDRLLRLGMLEATPEGGLRNRAGSQSGLRNDLKADAFRKLQRQILEKALSALDSIPLELRSQTSMTMSVSSSRLAGAVERITTFRRELCAYLEADPERDQVYQLSISLFPLTSRDAPSSPEEKENPP